MSLTETPICNFGEKIKDFKLKSTSGTFISLKDIKGQNGTLIMFICNHCPYVKAIIKELVNITNDLLNIGVNSVAIMANDTKEYPEDSFENMKKFSKINNFNFLYLYDETQEVAKNYGAVCTPDFFGYNKNNELQYRGRMTEIKNLKPLNEEKSELIKAMELIAKTNKGPKKQYPSMGCNIKWKK
jgi:peroxiredoxin